MQTNTLVIIGFLAVILMLSSCEGSKLFLDDNDDNMELSEAKARMFLEGANDDDFDKRAQADTDCVPCKFHIFRCCKPNLCLKKFLRPDECMEIKPGK